MVAAVPGLFVSLDVDEPYSGEYGIRTGMQAWSTVRIKAWNLSMIPATSDAPGQPYVALTINGVEFASLASDDHSSQALQDFYDEVRRRVQDSPPQASPG